MKNYSLKELFELRHIRSLKPRMGFGRYFLHLEKPGFGDGSGAVWPVKIESSQTCQHLLPGCVYRFWVDTNFPRQKSYSKYRDQQICIVVSQLQKVAGHEDATWELIGVDSPVECVLSSAISGAGSDTFFFPTNTSKRLLRLNQRAKGLQRVRSFFLNRSYLELDPPHLVLSGGVERYLKTFTTQYEDHRGQKWDMELPTSPEFSLKKILAEGATRVFALTHAFRNSGELSRHHDPEFMILEWYRMGGSFEDLISETQALIMDLASCLPEAIELPRGSWPRYTVSDLFFNILNLNLSKYSEVVDFRQDARKICSSVVETDSWDDVFCKLFMEFVEPFLAKRKACFVTHYPQQMGALAAKSVTSSGFVDRFEAYIDGVEICNGYRELTDYDDYLSRVNAIVAERNDVRRDAQFESVMKAGLYPCVGNALGIDRLISVLQGLEKMQDLLPWPFASRFQPKSIALE